MTNFQSNNLPTESTATPVASKPRRSTGKRLMQSTLLVIIGFLLVYCAALFFLQRKLIYFPRGYEPSYRMGLPKGTVELEFQTSDGRQVAFYVPPLGSAGPPTGQHRTESPAIWVLFNGNASTALDWLDTVEQFPEGDAAFLLVDFPGYGLCEGSPTRDGIIKGFEGAWSALAKHLGTTTTDLDTRVNTMGLSIGCAPAMEFAVRHPVKKIVLLAPFTSLVEIATIQPGVFPPLNQLVRDRFDNRARLAELSKLPNPPSVAIYHGMADEVITVKMGRDMASEFSSFVTFKGYPEVTHNWIVDAARKDYYEFMAREKEKE